jgi:hypothetical protein
VKSRWWSARAIWLHGAIAAWVAGCVAASVWQVGRAFQGNTLSYLYSFEWPFFAVIGIWGWWALIHLDDVAEALPAPHESVADPHIEAVVAREIDRGDEDESLSAYNDHLARLAARPKKRLFGH